MESVAGITWNRWPPSRGMSGRDQWNTHIDFGIKRGAFRDGFIYLDSLGWVQNGTEEKIGFWMDFVRDKNESAIDDIGWDY